MSKNMKKIEVKRVKSFSNAEIFKLENKSIGVLELKDDSYVIELKLVSDDLRPRAIHTVLKNKVVSTVFLIEKKSAVILAEAILKQYNK